MEALITIVWCACGQVTVTDYDHWCRERQKDPDGFGRMVAFLFGPIIAPMIAVETLSKAFKEKVP